MGSRHGLEQNLIGEEGYSLISLPIQGLLGQPLIQKLRFPAFLILSFFICLLALSRERPRVVVGCGGYVSFPVLLAASFLGIPTLISEQDSRPGLSTSILARFADEIHLPTPQAASFFPKGKQLFISGNPLRTIISPIEKGVARRRFGLNEKMKTVLVFGGSQGASSINRAFSSCLSYLLERPEVQFIWVTGKRDHSWAVRVKEKALFEIRVEEFIGDMGYVYAASDLVVSRAGGLATAEITALGLPSILIPYPFATGGHQEVNARSLERQGAARVILDEDLNGEVLAGAISSLISDEGTLKEMADRSRMRGRRNGAERIADSILSLAQRARRG